MKTRNILLSIALTFIVLSVQSQENTDYYFSKTISVSFEEATTKVKSALKAQQFGIITEIDMHEKMAEKLDDIDVKPYRILGACNPKFAYDVLQKEENIGLFLPCKVLVKQIDKNSTEVVMVNPTVLMQMLGNNELISLADEVTKRFKMALDSLE